MNPHLQNIIKAIEQNEQFTAEEKAILIKSAKDADKELEITAFKLDRTEKVKRTTAVLLEETIAELEQKRKAVEKQNRELEIEAALERVRSRTMAMHKSKELAEVSALLYKELQGLGITQFLNCGYVEIDELNHIQNAWMTNADGLGFNVVQLPLTGDSVFDERYEAWKRKAKLFHQVVGGEVLKNHIELGTQHYRKTEIDELVRTRFPDPTIFYCGNFNYGYLNIITGTPLTEGQESLLIRFTKVFEMTYGRFLDLQKAEAQTREAQIEAALERVRSRTMAMQRSDELAEVATVLFQQVKALGIPQWTCGFCIFEIDDKEFTWYPGGPNGEILPPSKIPLLEHPIFIQFNESRKRGEELYIYEKTGEVQEDHYRYMCSLPVVGEYLQRRLDAGEVIPAFQIDHLANFSHGNLIFITYEHFPEMHDIFKRFAKVFDQTYTRFLDLQKAEAQALEAIKRASVDRVRAEIASMRTTKDLERITPLVWNELTTLGVPFIRCGVFIMDEERQLVETHLSTPAGEAIATFNLPYNTPGVTMETVEHWHKKELYKQHWNETQFIEFTQNLVQQGAITSGEKYLTKNRPADLYLHFVPFLQGMLYAGNTSPLSDDELQLMQNLADAFSTAYARYEDFNKLEAAKKIVENTLTDLKQAQQQLVQSEKMASLGELTAGIAHEIQNPLNFVNNFSEVSNELLDEMMEELAKGNVQSAKEIVEDVKQNLEKILHHGKRADGIVKGMLQHSRTSSGQKEPTDINALCDEYLRLSYHGLRAKDKLFNATTKTEFDNSIGKVNVVPQEMGRVILNLINNAFYAVSERKKLGQEGYEPAVSVSTKKENGHIEVKVKDNGTGIPQKVIDKIFQPFFTTKPTGQGTGLGLSLSYDIVKAHGGELKVETKEGEGSEFIISLPV